MSKFLIAAQKSKKHQKYQIATTPYIKNPNPITLLTGTPETTTCEISEEFHEEILTVMKEYRGGVYTSLKKYLF